MQIYPIVTQRVKKRIWVQMNSIFSKVKIANKIAIAGHVRPDGDCVGSCMAMYLYLRKLFPDKQIDVYLEGVPSVFSFIKDFDAIKDDYSKKIRYDVFISLDCGDEKRLGPALPYFESAIHTINVDHHISNTLFAEVNYVMAESSSTCETLYDLFEEDKIDVEIATALYTGIIHDTGVFKHSNTSKNTLTIAGKLVEHGVSFSKIIDESFYQKTYIQNQLLGRALLESILVLDGQCIYSVISKDELEFYGATAKDTDGIIDQLRITKGVEVAILIHETGSQIYKVSMRSNTKVNVSEIATFYGGGGHIRAAGCTMTGTHYDVINNLIRLIDIQLQESHACITE